jgi:hypothetical protein
LVGGVITTDVGECSPVVRLSPVVPEAERRCPRPALHTIELGASRLDIAFEGCGNIGAIPCLFREKTA